MPRRDKRITLRFYLDEPEACALYQQLSKQRQETGQTMSAIIMAALKEYLDTPGPDPNAALRGVIREEVRSALREWAIAHTASEPEALGEHEPDLEADPESVLAAASFTL